MAKLKWHNTRSLKNTPIQLKKDLVANKIRKQGPPTYRHGDFWIGDKLVEKYRPGKSRVFQGIFFNQETGRFEAWRNGKVLSSMNWKIGQPALLEWANKFGW